MAAAVTAVIVGGSTYLTTVNCASVWLGWLAVFRNTDTQSLCLAGKEIRYRDCSEWKKVTDATPPPKTYFVFSLGPAENGRKSCALLQFTNSNSNNGTNGQGRADDDLYEN